MITAERISMDRSIICFKDRAKTDSDIDMLMMLYPKSSELLVMLKRGL